jgi:hypothetical protein
MKEKTAKMVKAAMLKAVSMAVVVVVAAPPLAPAKASPKPSLVSLLWKGRFAVV